MKESKDILQFFVDRVEDMFLQPEKWGLYKDGEAYLIHCLASIEAIILIYAPEKAEILPTEITWMGNMYLQYLDTLYGDQVFPFRPQQVALELIGFRASLQADGFYPPTKVFPFIPEEEREK